MAEAKKKATKKATKPSTIQWELTKPNGKIIYRDGKNTDDRKKKRLEAKGWKVKEV